MTRPTFERLRTVSPEVEVHAEPGPHWMPLRRFFSLNAASALLFASGAWILDARRAAVALAFVAALGAAISIGLRLREMER